MNDIVFNFENIFSSTLTYFKDNDSTDWHETPGILQ